MCCGLYIYMIVIDLDNVGIFYVYGLGMSFVCLGDEFEGCFDEDLGEDDNMVFFSIDVIEVFMECFEDVCVVNWLCIFVDLEMGKIVGFWKGGCYGVGMQCIFIINQCYDIIVYFEIGFVVGVCLGNGILFDVFDLVNLVWFDVVVDEGFVYWYLVMFNNVGDKVVFIDEWGGGMCLCCCVLDFKCWGVNVIFDIVDCKFEFCGYYKLFVLQMENENCVVYNGLLILVLGCDIMVQVWYQGGILVFDFIDLIEFVEIVYFDCGLIVLD